MIKIELIQSAFGGDFIQVTKDNGEFVEQQSFRDKQFHLTVRENGTFNIDFKRADDE